MSKKTVCVDFDGVLHSYTSGWTGEVPTDDPEPGAVAFVQSLLDLGYKVVVMTTRAQTPGGYDGVIKWLEQHQFPQVDSVTHHKVPAIAYVDDRAVSYDSGSGNFATPTLEVMRLEHLGKNKGRGK